MKIMLLRMWRPFFDICDGVLQIENFSGKVNGQIIAGSGAMNWKGEDPLISGNVNFPI